MVQTRILFSCYKKSKPLSNSHLKKCQLASLCYESSDSPNILKIAMENLTEYTEGPSK